MHKRYIVYEEGSCFGDDEKALRCAVRVTVSVTDEFYQAFVTDRKRGFTDAQEAAVAFRMIRNCVEDLAAEFTNQAEAPFLLACAALQQGDNSILAKGPSYIAGCHAPCCYSGSCNKTPFGEPPTECPLPPASE